MEYANSLQNYLKENFKKLTWEDKYKLSYQLICGISYLHDEEIIHRNLHSNNVLINQNTIKLADFGLSKRIKEASERDLDLFDTVPYVDPKKFVSNKSYLLNKKSDVYSIGVILWEISSGQPPFKDQLYDSSLVMQISKGYREAIVSDTPSNYSSLYIECWNGEPDNRPTMSQVVAKIKAIVTNSSIITEDYQTFDLTLNHSLIKNKQQFNIDPSTADDLSHEVNFNRISIREVEPTIQNINENIYEEDLSIVVNELVNLYFKEVNEGIEERVRKKHILDYINNLNINLQEIYNWLLNNQNDSNFIQLLGYFNYYGIVINADVQKAFKLYQKAAELENIVAQFELANMYMDGEGTDKDYEKAFKLSKKLADKEYSSGINLLGYCHDIGIGTDVDKLKAFELYLKAANLDNSIAQHNIGHMYKDGEGIEQDFNKSIEFFKKSAEKGYSDGMTMLGFCYNNGLGTDPDKKMAFKLYEKAANLENSVAQFNIALMYEYGNEIGKDINQAIYWYKKSAKQGYQNAQNKLKKLNKNIQEI
ncbi:hypothetical protein C1646_697668 [Rhizophagus diaphanus]|nr:hypothetical protein C1646_697668 [Rhizophagus diaphanus] [Rhizophagus sp. MUCL 43196]